jgi:hypothetical protein
MKLLCILTLAIPVTVLLGSMLRVPDQDLSTRQNRTAYMERGIEKHRQFNLTDTSQVTRFIYDAISMTDTSYRYYRYGNTGRCLHLVKDSSFCELGEPCRRGVIDKWQVDLSWIGSTVENVHNFCAVIAKEDVDFNDFHYKVHFNVYENDYSECYVSAVPEKGIEITQRFEAKTFQELDLSNDTTGTFKAFEALCTDRTLNDFEEKEVVEEETPFKSNDNFPWWVVAATVSTAAALSSASEARKNEEDE